VVWLQAYDSRLNSAGIFGAPFHGGNTARAALDAVLGDRRADLAEPPDLAARTPLGWWPRLPL